MLDELQGRLGVADALRGNVFQLQQHREAGRGVCAVVDDQDLHAANYLPRPAPNTTVRELVSPHSDCH